MTSVANSFAGSCEFRETRGVLRFSITITPNGTLIVLSFAPGRADERFLPQFAALTHAFHRSKQNTLFDAA
jgi:hypothetical protein